MLLSLTVDPKYWGVSLEATAQELSIRELGRNALRGPNFTWVTSTYRNGFPYSSREVRFDVQFFIQSISEFGLPVWAGRHSR